MIVQVPANTWTDLYAATGVTVGRRLLVQNVGSADVNLYTSAVNPGDLRQVGQVISREQWLRNAEGSPGEWALVPHDGGLLSVEEVAN